MTPLDDALTERRRRYIAGPVTRRIGRQPAAEPATTKDDEIWFAVSACHRWTYRRVDGVAGTPWECTYGPTGQITTHGSLPAARRWTEHDGGEFALANLRAGALEVVDRRGGQGAVLVFAPGTPDAERARARAREAERCAERVGAARRCIAVLDGLLLADVPDARCTGDCGGYLTIAFAGERAAWVHADTCRECIDEKRAGRLACPAIYRHVPCGDPEPVTCEHSGCSSTAVYLVAGVGCPRGRDACCGCCEHDE